MTPMLFPPGAAPAAPGGPVPAGGQAIGAPQGAALPGAPVPVSDGGFAAFDVALLAVLGQAALSEADAPAIADAGSGHEAGGSPTPSLKDGRLPALWLQALGRDVPTASFAGEGVPMAAIETGADGDGEFIAAAGSDKAAGEPGVDEDAVVAAALASMRQVAAEAAPLPKGGLGGVPSEGSATDSVPETADKTSPSADAPVRGVTRHDGSGVEEAKADNDASLPSDASGSQRTRAGASAAAADDPKGQAYARSGAEPVELTAHATLAPATAHDVRPASAARLPLAGAPPVPADPTSPPSPAQSLTQLPTQLPAQSLSPTQHPSPAPPLSPTPSSAPVPTPTPAATMAAALSIQASTPAEPPAGAPDETVSEKPTTRNPLEQLQASAQQGTMGETPADGRGSGGEREPRRASELTWTSRSSSIEARLAPPSSFVMPGAPAVMPGAALAAWPVAHAAPGQAFEMPAPAENLAHLVQSIRVQAREGVSQASVRLNPEHLGEVTIAIRVEAGSVVAVVRAESGDVRQWLRGQEESIRLALAEQGLTLDELVVEQDGQRRQQGEQDAERQPRRSRVRGRSVNEPSFEVTA